MIHTISGSILLMVFMTFDHAAISLAADGMAILDHESRRKIKRSALP